MRKERRFSRFSTLTEPNPKLSMEQFYNIRMTNTWRKELTARMLITNKCYNTRHNEQENQFQTTKNNILCTLDVHESVHRDKTIKITSMMHYIN
jgi:hypothetical protein